MLRYKHILKNNNLKITLFIVAHIVGGSASCPSAVAPDNIWLVHLRHSN